MDRKTLALCTALAALAAMAVAATGAPATTLKDTVNGGVTKVETGKRIIGISTTESILKKGFEEYRCNESSLAGIVVNGGTDTGGVVEWTISAASFQGTQAGTKCASSLGDAGFDVSGLTWCLKGGGAADVWSLTPANTCSGSGALTFTITVPLGAFCKYTRTAAFSGTVTTPGASNASTLTVTGEPEFAFVEGSSICGTSSLKITKMAFNLYTDTSATNYALDEEDPIWASVS